MKKVILIILSVVCISALELQPYLGLQMGYGEEKAETKFHNPQGRFGARIVTGYGLNPYIEHISSIPNVTDGYGFNAVGINAVTPSYSDFDAYVGYGYKPDGKWNNKTYARTFDENFYRYGIRYKSGDKYLYAESIQDRMYSFGVEWVF